MENPEAAVQVVTAGEALVDVLRRADGLLEPCAGGSVFNLSRALARQGVGTAYLNPLSADGFGRMLAQQLHDDGVWLGRPQPVTAPTSLALVDVDAQGQPRYGFWREGVADRAVDAASLREAMATRPALRAACTGGMALAPQDRGSYLPWLQACRDRGLTVVVDANLRPSAMHDRAAWLDTIRAALALADVIKVSDEDLALLSPQVGDPLAAAAQLFSLGAASCIALTLGAGGAVLLARDGRRWQAQDQAALPVVDTVGAGDCFLAGLVAGLAGSQLGQDGPAGSDAVAALRRAVASASCCVQQRGCVPPDVHALAAWLARDSIRVNETGAGMLAEINK